MLKSRLTRSVLALLMVGAALSCAPDGRESPLAPEATTAAPSQTSDLLGLWPKVQTSSEYTLVEERSGLLPSLQISRVIGLLGGTVSLAGHTVTVPSGAVTLPTVFTLTLLPTGYVEVEVTALQTTLLGRIVNIGEQGFRKPVNLTLTYARATNVTDPSRLRIMRVNDNGRHEILPSIVDADRMIVTARLDHFSRYCMITH